MNSFEHIRSKIDGVFVFSQSNHGHYICDHSESMVCTLEMLKLQNVLSLHTFETSEQIKTGYALIRKAMKIRSKASLFRLQEKVVLVCSCGAKITHDTCHDLCAWIRKMSEKKPTLNTFERNIQLGVVQDFEKLCSDFAQTNSAEYVLINILYADHYASIASYPVHIDGLWRCHSICHHSVDLTYKEVSLENHPFELSHTTVYYSGIVHSNEPTIMVCALSTKQGSLVDGLAKLSSEIDMGIKLLKDTGLLSCEYWMWRYIKPFSLNSNVNTKSVNTKCCLLM